MPTLRKALASLALVVAAAGMVAAQEGPGPEARKRCLGANPDAPILIEVYSDYQCPACRQFYLSTMRQVIADYALSGKACVVYHEFPLRIHQYAREAARYGQAAARLGQMKWIRVSDALYHKQSLWSSTGDVESVVASALSADEMKKVQGWVDSGELDKEIDQDVAEARRRNVRQTPTTFITARGNTEAVAGVQQYPIFRRYLEYLLAQR